MLVENKRPVEGSHAEAALCKYTVITAETSYGLSHFPHWIRSHSQSLTLFTKNDELPSNRHSHLGSITQRPWDKRLDHVKPPFPTTSVPCDTEGQHHRDGDSYTRELCEQHPAQCWLHKRHLVAVALIPVYKARPSVAQMVKNPPAMQETQFRSLG